MILNKIIGLIIISFSLYSCVSSNESLSFKNREGQTGIFELDSNGVFYTELGDCENVYKLKPKASIGINEFESLSLYNGYCIEEKCIEFKLTKIGTEMYTELTKKNIGQQIFYVIDGVVVLKLTVAGFINNGMGQFPINVIYFDSLFMMN